MQQIGADLDHDGLIYDTSDGEAEPERLHARAGSADLRRGRAKLEIGVARGKKAHDKRRTIAERDMRRELEREAKATGRIKL